MSFDYGTDEVAEAGGNFKNPEIGDHSARLRSIIHCGMFRETYDKTLKKPCPEVVAIFELKDEEDFEDDEITPLTISKAFPLKKGDKSFMTKFIKALAPKGDAKGFDDLIGRACQVNCKPSKVLDDDGNPKYVNFGGISGLPAKFAKLTDPLIIEGVGHVPFEELTKEAILELNPITEVAYILCKGERYIGSLAEELVKEIRIENPEFAILKQSTASEKPASESPVDGAKEEVKTNLKDDEVF